MQEATMSKEDSEMKTMSKEDSEKTETPEGKKPTGRKPKVVVVKQQPQVYKTNIAARLDKGVLKGAESGVNRSSDLVPLSQEYDQMRKRLRNLIVATKKYRTASVQVEKARMEATVQLAAFSANFPLYEYVSSPRSASLALVHQLVTQNADISAQQYQRNIIDYAIEWEQIVTARVDDGLKKTNVLYQKLNHYQNKIDSLRKKVNAVENKGKESSTKLNEKLTRNEAKVKKSWELHEASASTLCNLLEEVTKGGWKDLHPLAMAALQWEVDRVTEEQDAYGMLSNVMKDMPSPCYEQASVPVAKQRAKDLFVGSTSTTAADDSDSDTTGPPDVVSISSCDDGDDTFKTAEPVEWN